MHRFLADSRIARNPNLYFEICFSHPAFPLLITPCFIVDDGGPGAKGNFIHQDLLVLATDRNNIAVFLLHQLDIGDCGAAFIIECEHDGLEHFESIDTKHAVIDIPQVGAPPLPMDLPDFSGNEGSTCKDYKRYDNGTKKLFHLSTSNQ
jgi:hypothetical protein